MILAVLSIYRKFLQFAYTDFGEPLGRISPKLILRRNAGEPNWRYRSKAVLIERGQSIPSLALPSRRTTFIDFVATHHGIFSFATRLVSHVLAIATGRHSDAVAKEIG